MVMKKIRMNDKVNYNSWIDEGGNKHGIMGWIIAVEESYESRPLILRQLGLKNERQDYTSPKITSWLNQKGKKIAVRFRNLTNIVTCNI